MPTEKEYTLQEMTTCIERELKFRKSVYTKKVEKGTMKPEVARYEYDCMKAVLMNLKAQQPSLFNQKKKAIQS